MPAYEQLTDPQLVALQHFLRREAERALNRK
jgi:hypothetical protein